MLITIADFKAKVVSKMEQGSCLQDAKKRH